MKHRALPLPCVVAMLLFATISCTEKAPTELEQFGDVSLAFDSHKPNHGGGRPGGGGDDFSNWAFAVRDGSFKGNIELRSSDGGHNKKIARGGGVDRFIPRFTLDGRSVAYTVRSGPLRIVNVDGTNDRVLYPGGFGSYDWLPGSSRLIGVTGGLVVVADTATGLQKPVESLSDGSVGDIAQVNAVNAGPDLEPQTPGFQGPIALPGGDRASPEVDIYVVEAREDSTGGTFALSPATLVRLALPDPVDPGGPNGGYQNFPVFSPDGSQIAFLDRASCCRGRELRVVTFDVAAWAGGETDPALLFGPPETIASGGLVTNLRSIVDQPTWAPDGSWIAFYGDYLDNSDRLTLVRSDGTETRMHATLTALFPDWNPTWCNDIDDPGGC